MNFSIRFPQDPKVQAKLHQQLEYLHPHSLDKRASGKAGRVAVPFIFRTEFTSTRWGIRYCMSSRGKGNSILRGP